MTLGASPELFMKAAGVIEFTLAFALIWTPLVRRMSAIILAASSSRRCSSSARSMRSVIPLLSWLCWRSPPTTAKAALVRFPWLVPAAYAASVGVFLMGYYLAHTAIFGTSLT